MSDSKILSVDEPNSPNAANVVRRQRSGSVMSLELPQVDDALDMLSDEAAYTIPVARQGQPLAVTIKNVWPVNHAGVRMVTTVEYLWQGAKVHQCEIQGPYDPAAVFPLTEFLPASVLSTGGIRQLSYRISAPLLMPPAESFRTMVNVDKTAPNFGNPGAELIFDGEVLSGGVTENYLETHGGVGAEALRWGDMRLEDEIEYFWGELPNVNRVGTLRIGPGHIAGAPILIQFDEAFIRRSGEGRRYASFRLIDRAGNVGPFSTSTELQVDLRVLPDLPRPEVPLAEFDGLIDLDDARSGVSVGIDEIVGAQPGDSVFAFWNTHALPLVTIEAVQIWPISIRVSWEILTAGGFTGPGPVRVRYIFQRGTTTKNSPNNFLTLDLSVAGPDPQGPDPVNTRLPLVVVKGRTGDDIVTQMDAPGPVRVEATLYNNPEPKHTMTLHWGGEAAFAAVYEVKPGDVAGQTVFFDVRWDTILGAASGPIPVYYWTDNLVNRQRSPDKWVQVVLDTLKGLKVARLKNDSDRDFIHCDAIPEPWKGVYIGIPWDPIHFEVGDRCELYWSSYTTTNGSGTPIPGTEVMFQVTLTVDHENAGEAVVQILPFNPLITSPGLVERWGSALVQYRLFKRSGPTGVSPQKLIFIDLKRPGGGTCLGPTSTS